MTDQAEVYAVVDRDGRLRILNQTERKDYKIMDGETESLLYSNPQTQWKTLRWYRVSGWPGDPDIREYRGPIRGDLSYVAERIAEQYDAETDYVATYPITLALIDIDGTERFYRIERESQPVYTAFKVEKP